MDAPLWLALSPLAGAAIGLLLALYDTYVLGNTY
jgi:hypothetical protein